MILFRACQGFTGGVMIPMALTVALSTLPKSKQPLGFAMFGITATLGSAIGPSVGGCLTDSYGWQWDFYVNLHTGRADAVSNYLRDQTRSHAIEPVA